MIFGTYRDPTGRICPAYRPGDLREAHLNYEAMCQEDESVETQTLTAPELVDQRVRQYQEEHRGTPYEQAYRIVLREDPQLAAAYTGAPVPLPAPAPTGGDGVPADDRTRAGEFLDRFAIKHLDRFRGDYAAAFRAAMQANPEEARAYLGIGVSLEDVRRRLGPSAPYAVTHGTTTYQVSGGYQQKPADKPPSAEEARKQLLALVRARLKEGPDSALLSILETDEGKRLLAIILGEK